MNQLTGTCRSFLKSLGLGIAFLGLGEGRFLGQKKESCDYVTIW